MLPGEDAEFSQYGGQDHAPAFDVSDGADLIPAKLEIDDEALFLPRTVERHCDGADARR